MTDYRMNHRAPVSGVSLATIYVMFPDIHAHPEWYEEIDQPTLATLRRVKDKPLEYVTVYRALPPDATQEINPGDWVTISEAYARQHAMQEDGSDWPVVSLRVQAGSLFNDGSSVFEYGWAGE
jgi:hypothetical protein